MKILRNLTLIRASAIAAIALMGLTLSSPYAFTQATYNYTGNNYTAVDAGSPFNTSMHVTATLQFGSWLPPGLYCVDVSTLPGFRLIMNDGLDTFDTSSPSGSGSYGVLARVSTDGEGRITTPWEISLVAGQSNMYSFAVIAYACYVTLAVTDGARLAGGGMASNLSTHGTWSYPSASDLTIMLTNEINLQHIGSGKSLTNKLTQIRNDITANSGYTCLDLSSFAGAVRAQTGKKITAAQSTFILQTVSIMQSELSCRE